MPELLTEETHIHSKMWPPVITLVNIIETREVCDAKSREGGGRNSKSRSFLSHLVWLASHEEKSSIFVKQTARKSKEKQATPK